MFQVMATRSPFPVLCDRCHAQGLAGEAEFERLAGLGDLLDFEPVPRRVARADGWTPDIQRAYVAALAVTGSERQAAAAVERAAYGVTQLRQAEGNEGFLAACEKAMEIYRERERVRRSDNLLAAAYGEAARTRPRLAWSGAASRRLPELPPHPGPETEAGQAETDKVVEELLHVLARKYFSKLEQERQARLEGRIAEADFYVRQITCLEVSLDVVSGDGMAYLRDFRCLGHDLLHIAETEMSKLLDQARRVHWEQCGEPPRPDHPPLRLLVQKDGFAIEPLDATYSRHPDGLTHQEQHRLHQERHARDARAQIEWEAEAREAAAAWRERLEAEAAETEAAAAEAGEPSPPDADDQPPPR
jgi:hypothetical protein